MTNRKDRRAQGAKQRLISRAARLRCVGCERVGQKTTKEHIWPLWLIEHARVHNDGIRWLTDSEERISPKAATLPLCSECNHRLGSELEGPVSQILPRLEGGQGVTAHELELLARWLWKFEGLFASYKNAGNPGWRYSLRWTLIERVLGAGLPDLRDALTVSIGLINANDPGHSDWPMGIDSGLSDKQAIFVSGVFGKTSLMVGLTTFSDMIPNCYGKYNLVEAGPISANDRYYPPVCFPFAGDAISMTMSVSEPLVKAHEIFAREQGEPFGIVKAISRIELPDHGLFIPR